MKLWIKVPKTGVKNYAHHSPHWSKTLSQLIVKESKWWMAGTPGQEMSLG
jgi:hypothetical protein